MARTPMNSLSIEKDLNVQPPPTTPTPTTFLTKTKLVLCNLTVEPVMVMYTLPNVMAYLATQNLNLEKACRVNLKYPTELCDALTERNASGYTEQDEQTVQTLVSSMQAIKGVIQSLAPSLLLLFLGSWSDRHKTRKPCILLPIVGELMSCLLLLLNVYFFEELPMEVTAYTEAIPPSLAGGWFAMIMGVFSYVGGISDDDTSRTVRVGALHIFMTVSSTLGTALSGVLFKKIGFYGVYSTCACMYTSGILYTLFWVKEERVVQEGGKQRKSFLADFFDLTHVKETIKAAFKDGEKDRKKRICTIMLLVMVINGPLYGESNIYYLYVRYKFGWNEVDYSMFCTFFIVMHLAGTSFSLFFFSKYLKIDDALLAVISCASKIISCLVYAFAPNGTIFYLGCIAELLGGVVFISLRSIVSKLVPSEELGKINSLFGLCEALMPLFYAPMYNLLYNYTIDKFPGTFILLTGFLTAPALIIFYWLYREMRKDVLRDEALEHEKEEFLTEKKEDEIVCK